MFGIRLYLLFLGALLVCTSACDVAAHIHAPSTQGALKTSSNGSDDTTEGAPPDDLASDVGAHCDGPYEPIPVVDGCDSALDSFKYVFHDVDSLGSCFQLCADNNACRVDPTVTYSEKIHTCILLASCTPVGFEPYQATGGCSWPQACWDIREVPERDGRCQAEYLSWAEDASTPLGCLERCEEQVEGCAKEKRFAFDAVQGVCATQGSCPNGMPTYAYEEVPCGPDQLGDRGHSGPFSPVDTNLPADGLGAGARCEGPYEVTPTLDACSADLEQLHGVVPDVDSLEACFQHCAATRSCRGGASVAYSQESSICILDPSCTPEGFTSYAATRGCTSAKRCWEAEKVPAEEGICHASSDDGWGYYDVTSAFDCLENCELDPQGCAKNKRFAFDPLRRACTTGGDCPADLPTYAYREVSCDQCELLSEGEPCVADSECEDGLTCPSDTGKCVRIPLLGSPCTENTDCEPNRHCAEVGYCELNPAPPVQCEQPPCESAPDGAACAADSDCASRLCHLEKCVAKLPCHAKLAP